MPKFFGDSGKGNAFPKHCGRCVVPEHPGSCKAAASFNACGGYSSLDDVPGSVQFHIRCMDRKETLYQRFGDLLFFKQ